MPGMSTEDLQAETVLAAASQATGLDDYGDPGFVEGLSVYLESLRTESRLSAQGAAMHYQDIVRILSNRLGFQRDLKQHPEILDEPIIKPIIILGLPRTGSSKLQRMLASDPGAQRLDMWRLQFPAPFPGSKGVSPDPRIAMSEQIEAALISQFPEVMARHPMESHEVDEELWLLEMSFESLMTSIKTYAPKHRAWVEGHSQRNAYAYMRSLLQYLQWQDGGGIRGNRLWILKCVTHIGELPTVLETFPDATIVCTHRDPRKVITSFASLMDLVWKMYSDHVDSHELGNDFNQFWAKQTEKYIDACHTVEAGRILDVYFDDIQDRPDAVIADIYAHAGRELTLEARQAIAGYVARRPKNHFGAYQYKMEDYGLSNAKIEKAFANYMEKYPRLKHNL